MVGTNLTNASMTLPVGAGLEQVLGIEAYNLSGLADIGRFDLLLVGGWTASAARGGGCCCCCNGAWRARAVSVL